MKAHAAILLVIPLLLARAASAGEDEAVAQARQAAQEWLAIVDSGQYLKSWDEAATLFRSAVSRSNWVQAVKSARGPLGALLTRQLKSATFARTLPGAPDGEYVVIQYDTRFENKAAAIETITPMRDQDGRWRVSGYFVR
jgi:hypothetical protein